MKITSTKTNFHCNLASNYDHNHLMALHARFVKIQNCCHDLSLGFTTKHDERKWARKMAQDSTTFLQMWENARKLTSTLSNELQL